MPDQWFVVANPAPEVPIRGRDVAPENVRGTLADAVEIRGTEAAPPEICGADIAPAEMCAVEVVLAEPREPAMATEAAKQVPAINPKRITLVFI